MPEKGKYFHQLSRNKATPIFNVVSWPKSAFSKYRREEKKTFFLTQYILKADSVIWAGKKKKCFDFLISKCRQAQETTLKHIFKQILKYQQENLNYTCKK